MLRVDAERNGYFTRNGTVGQTTADGDAVEVFLRMCMRQRRCEKRH